MAFRDIRLLVVLVFLALILFALHLAIGPVQLSFSEVWSVIFGGPQNSPATLIVYTVRLPEALTAAAAGGGLAVCGLLMQTLFRNPLAGPSVLGLSSGASLGVALLILIAPPLFFNVIPVDLTAAVAAFAGSMGIFFLILLADRRMGDGVALLIVGLMLGYLCSAIISLLQLASAEPALKSFVVWGMGSFSGVLIERLPWLLVPVLIGLFAAFLLVKPLNALLLGDNYAASLGVQVEHTRRWVMVIAGLLAGVITAFCGPVAFLGLATPHVARGLCRSSDHLTLMPMTMLCGIVLALFCDLIIKIPNFGEGIPLNAITSLLGAPVVAWVLFSGKKWARST